MIKKIGLMALCSAITISVAACGGSSSPDGGAGDGKPKEAQKQEKINLRVAWWGNQDRHDLTVKALELYEKKHPNTAFKVEFAAFDAYGDKLTTQFTAGNAPDVMQMSDVWSPEYVSRGALLDLKPYIGKQLDLSAHDQKLIDASNAGFKGGVYQIPWTVNSIGVIYNKRIFKELGLNEPDPKWTYAGFEKLALQIADKSGGKIYGVTDMSGNADALDVYIRQHGSEFFVNTNQLGFSKPILANWFAMWERLRNANAATSAEITTSTRNDLANSPFILGKSAMVINHSNHLRSMQQLMKDEIGIAVFPAGTVPGMKIAISQYLAAYAKSSQPAESAKVIDFLLNDPDGGKILGSNRGIPISANVRNALKSNADPIDKMTYDFMDEASKHLGKPQENWPAGSGEMYNILTIKSEEIAFKKKTVDKVVDEFFAEVTKLMSKK